jgi:hypothetical protein
MTMDFAEVINQLTEHFEGLHFSIIGLVAFPDLTGFDKQRN